MKRPTSATRIALALLGASRGRALSATVLVGAADLLGVSGNAMRVALSRLAASGDVVLEERGSYALSPARLGAVARVRTFRTGFASRLAWQGRFLGVLTADLPRRNAALVARRERALDLAGFRHFAHGLWARPDNLEGGRAVVSAHLVRLGLEDDAEVLEVTLDGAQVKRLERAWNVAVDATRATALRERIEKFIASVPGKALRKVAAESFWLGDEVLRFLARDALLPETMADPAPRRELAEAMRTLDERGHAVWQALLQELEA
jgi:phenylacetic acid degradation operon negative regulatory protein